jgi:1,4-dihydroxy-2-naphthoate octaprenyltransferase
MAVTMGFLVPGMGYYIIRGGFDIGYLILAVPCFLYGYFFMIAVEMPDRESDRVSGKNTLVVRRGVTYAYGVALLATALATLLLVIPSLLGFYLPGLALLGICSVIPLLCSARWYTSLCPDEPCIVGRSARGILALVAFVTLGDLVLLLAVARL